MATRKQSIQGLDYRVQIALGLALLGGVGYGVYTIVNAIRRAEARRKAQEEAEKLKGEIQALQTTTGQSQSYPESQYTTMADTLYYAMAGWGTDEESIFSTFGTLVNNVDFLKLQTAFGSRDGYSLTEWLRGDLSSDDIRKINSLLTDRGIIYRF